MRSLNDVFLYGESYVDVCEISIKSCGYVGRLNVAPRLIYLLEGPDDPDSREMGQRVAFPVSIESIFETKKRMRAELFI